MSLGSSDDGWLLYLCRECSKHVATFGTCLQTQPAQTYGESSSCVRPAFRPAPTFGNSAVGCCGGWKVGCLYFWSPAPCTALVYMCAFRMVVVCYLLANKVTGHSGCCAGISALCYVFTSDDDQQMQNMTNTWHALVAATADTGIRLKLRAHCLIPPGHVLLPPSTVELAQRLTAVSLSFEHPAYLAAVFCLSALRHLQLGCSAKTGMALLDGAGAGAAATPCQLSSLRTLQLTGVPPAALFSPATAACLQQLHSVSLRDCHLPDGVLPSELLRLPSLSRLDLLQLPLRMMPDLRGLPALRILIMSGERNAPDLDASQAECSADLKAALKTNPLGGATCLTAAVLHGIPVATRECAEAIARLPDLELLGVDFLVCEHSAFWAATLQRSMHWRCRPASDFVIGEDGVVLSRWLWPDEDW